MKDTRNFDVKKIEYCEDKKFICPICFNDIDVNTHFHCGENIVPDWKGCYCCDDKDCCKDDRCTCRGQNKLKYDPIHGYDYTYGYIRKNNTRS